MVPPHTAGGVRCQLPARRGRLWACFLDRRADAASWGGRPTQAELESPMPAKNSPPHNSPPKSNTTEGESPETTRVQRWAVPGWREGARPALHGSHSGIPPPPPPVSHQGQGERKILLAPLPQIPSVHEMVPKPPGCPGLGTSCPSQSGRTGDAEIWRKGCVCVCASFLRRGCGEEGWGGLRHNPWLGKGRGRGRVAQPQERANLFGHLP